MPVVRLGAGGAGLFILAIQLFVTLIEFKLTTLAGFVLIPFGLFGKTAFMAERVLGNVISSGIKVLVLAVIIGIGSTLFGQFTAGFGGATPTIDDAMAIVLAALSLLGLGIFGPGIATGLVSGGPQLSAGAAVGTGLAVGGAAIAAGGATMLAARGSRTLGRGSTCPRRCLGRRCGFVRLYPRLLGRVRHGRVASGLGGVARAGASAAVSPLKRAASRASDSLKSSYSDGAKAGFAASGGTSTMGTVGRDSSPAPSTPQPLMGRRPGRSRCGVAGP